jgi:hypothetical protein
MAIISRCSKPSTKKKVSELDDNTSAGYQVTAKLNSSDYIDTNEILRKLHDKVLRSRISELTGTQFDPEYS